MPRTKPFEVGKVPQATLLRTVYPYLGPSGPDLLVGPGVGRDSAAVRVGNRVLVLSTDPITGTSSNVGGHSVYINANDIATAGGRPKWYLCTILLPPKSSEKTLRGLMAGIELVRDRDTRQSYPASEKVGMRVIMEARRHGVIIRPLGNVIVLMPPLCISEKELTQLCDATRASIAAVTGDRRR